MVTRRSFIGAMLSASVAPAFVRSESLMVVKRRIWTPSVASALFCDKHGNVLHSVPLISNNGVLDLPGGEFTYMAYGAVHGLRVMVDIPGFGRYKLPFKPNNMATGDSLTIQTYPETGLMRLT